MLTVAAADTHACCIALPACSSQMRRCISRDRLIGLLTERAARTLLYYLSETNLNVYHWFTVYIKENPIPRVRLPGAIACCPSAANVSPSRAMGRL